jgi:hypothetical protein
MWLPNFFGIRLTSAIHWRGKNITKNVQVNYPQYNMPSYLQKDLVCYGRGIIRNIEWNKANFK